MYSSAPMVRVVVADDHAMFREMLRIALPRNSDLEVVGEAEDGNQLLDVVARTRPGVILLDYKMPHVTDFAVLIRTIVQRHPGTRILVLSGFASPDIAARAAHGGASGYVLKSTRLGAVAEAIRAVSGGGIWIDPGLPRAIFDIFQRQTVAAHDRSGLGELTRREREVLARLARGASNRDIAQALGISEPTVKTHLTRIFTKLDVKNRVAAALVFYGKVGETEAGAPAADCEISTSRVPLLSRPFQ